MENLFLESEEIGYIDIIGDPVYDIYEQDNMNFINYQLPKDVIMNQSQTVISREDVHGGSHFNPIKEGLFVRRMEIVEDMIDGKLEEETIMFVIDKILGLKTTVKIRGRIFSNPKRMMQRDI
ncbi:Uncharacterized protein Rs2_03169 [Raphanus sativus]|nr:Uncharacterized protein Rs2_03169 [Raphanus sativus]